MTSNDSAEDGKMPSDIEELSDESLSANQSDTDPGDRDADFSAMDGGDAAKLAKEVSGLAAQLADMKDKYLRALADFENFKKRSIKERSDLIKYQGEKVIVDFLNILDNFELAQTHSEGDLDSIKAGLDMILMQFHEVLARWDVKAVGGQGQGFDPNIQSAISKVPSSDFESGSVVQELKKTYFYKDKLIRPGEVVVAE